MIEKTMIVLLVTLVLLVLNNSTSTDGKANVNKNVDVENNVTDTPQSAYNITNRTHSVIERKGHATDIQSDCGANLNFAVVGDKVAYVSRLSVGKSNVTNITSLTCWANLTSLPNTVMSLLLLNTECYSKGYVYVMDGSTYFRWQICLDADIIPLGSDFTATSNMVNIRFVVSDLSSIGVIQIYAEIVTELNGTELQVKHLSATEGFVQMSGPSSRVSRFTAVDRRVFINIPQGHRIMVTGLYLHSDSLPRRLQNDQWNCSVPHWPKFKLHFKCNHREECFSGKDEQTCPYKPCELGGVAMFGSCYFYLPPKKRLTWFQAQQNCKKAGARYRNLPQWGDLTIAFSAHHMKLAVPPACGFVDHRLISIRFLICNSANGNFASVCEKEIEKKATPPLVDSNRPRLPTSLPQEPSVPYIACPSGHLTHKLLACDTMSHCWGKKHFESTDERKHSAALSCPAPLTLLPPSFACSTGEEYVPFSMVCDHSRDCRDFSDEDFCDFPACDGQGQFLCINHQCVPGTKRCNGIIDCRDGSDEETCVFLEFSDHVFVPPPAVVHFDLHGLRKFILKQSSECPDTHFKCPDGYCLPMYTLCNGIYDCQEHEDEQGCDSFVCAGFYRCRGSTVCLHTSHVCDGWPQCPQHDDERFCNLTCPDECVCFGYSFTCNQTFLGHKYPEVRYLDATGSGMKTDILEYNHLLVFLSLATCALKQVGNTILSNLQTLDVSNNHLQVVTISDLTRFPKLKFLTLAGNPLTSFVRPERGKSVAFVSLIELDLSFVELSNINKNTFNEFPNMQVLNLSQSKIEKVHERGLHALKSLQVLDVTGCQITTVSGSMFDGLDALQHVYADNYKICCPAILPPRFVLENCEAPFDEISSCDALLRSDVYRISLSVFASLSTFGNTMSFLFRVFVLKNTRKSGFAAFVIHLCVADFLMGVYLVIIGVADRFYLNTYLWEDEKWKTSVVCQLAGFLSLLSSEMSAFVICLVTVDRFFVLRFPFSHLHFHPRSAHVTCTALWVIGIIIAAIPFLPALSYWDFYSQTGLCIPLPITRQTFPGHYYAFGVMIVFNFVLFLFIAAGQIFIYNAVQSQSMSGRDSKSKDRAVAQRLFIIVFSDFLCWFPIGLLGLLASRGIPVSSEVNVGVAIFMLPLNSTLNPFLYTVNLIRERSTRKREEKLFKAIFEEMKTEARNV